MPILSTEHHDLHYITQGQPQQPPLLLLHGFLGSHQDFISLLATFSQHFYCIVPDLPGHGQTRSQPNGYAFLATAQSLITLLRHLHITKTHLLGYSMGGRIALYLTCQFPEYFRRVVLESASPGLKSATERTHRRKHDQAIAQRLITTPLVTFLDQWYRAPLFASLHNHPAAYAAMTQRRQQNNPTELAKALQSLGTGQQPSLWTALSTLSHPLLLIVGALDAKFVAISRDMRSAAHTASPIQQAVIENCGHNLHLEAPVTYARTVCCFLMQQP